MRDRINMKSKIKELNDKTFLYNEYINKKISAVKISEMIGCSYYFVIKALSQFGIKIRNCKERSIGELNPFYGKHHSKEMIKLMSEAKSGKLTRFTDEYHKKFKELNDPEFLIKKYWDESLSLREIAKLIGCGLHGVVSAFEYYNIDTRTNEEGCKMENRNKKISDSKIGENNPNWKGGITTIPFKERYGVEIIEWKKITQEIRKRDKFICQFCGKYPSVEIHHITPVRIKINNSQENLITLCKSCHKKIEYITNEYLERDIDPIEIFYEKWSS